MCALVTGVQTCALPISWLTDRRGGLAFPVPCGPVTHIDRRSPLTVAAAAPVLHRLPVLASRRASDAKNLHSIQHRPAASLVRTEERRGRKEGVRKCRHRGAPLHSKKNI